jgi:Flp pilus assembly protein TadG
MSDLRRDQSGATAVQFALVSPIFFVALFGLFEFARVMFVGAMLESAVAEASRYGTTGAVVAGAPREQRILEIVSERTLGLVPIDEATVATLIYPGFDSIGQAEAYTDLNGNGQFDTGEPFEDFNINGQWDTDMGMAGPGGPGDIVLFRVDYDIPLLTPFIKPLVEDIHLSSSIAVRNEPF